VGGRCDTSHCALTVFLGCRDAWRRRHAGTSVVLPHGAAIQVPNPGFPSTTCLRVLSDAGAGHERYARLGTVRWSTSLQAVAATAPTSRDPPGRRRPSTDLPAARRGCRISWSRRRKLGAVVVEGSEIAGQERGGHHSSGCIATPYGARYETGRAVAAGTNARLETGSADDGRECNPELIADAFRSNTPGRRAGRSPPHSCNATHTHCYSAAVGTP
jgi:hypothetical protein